MERTYTTRQRILALALVICFAVALALSCLFVVSHADHDCTGEGCGVCAQLQVCLSILQRAVRLALLLSAAAALCRLWNPHVTISSQGRTAASLVRLKIRMDN